MVRFAFVPSLALPSSQFQSTSLCGSRVRSLRSTACTRVASLQWVPIHACITPIDQPSKTEKNDELAVDPTISIESTAPVVEAKVDEPVPEGIIEAPVPDEMVEVPISEPVAEEKAEDSSESVAETVVEAADDKPSDDSKKPRIRRKRKRYQREVTLPLEKLEVGMELKGTVKSVTKYGAFIGDLGTPTDGLLHVSQLAAGYVENVTDVVQVGSKVTVRVTEVNLERGNFSLTMRDPGEEAGSAPVKKNGRKEREAKWDAFRFNPTEFIEVTVTSVMDFGAFCRISDEAPTEGLVHISEMSESHVNSVSDIVEVGQAVKVRVLSVDRKRNRISLSMLEDRADKPVNAEAAESGDGNTPTSLSAEIRRSNNSQPVFKTAFEIAFERAGLKNKS